MYNLGQHHFHQRMRAQKAGTAAPVRSRLAGYADKAVYAAGILTPLMTIPQIYAVWASRDPSGVSLVSWIFYLTGALAWTAYGMLHKEKPIIFANASLALVDSLVVLGVLLYR